MWQLQIWICGTHPLVGVVIVVQLLSHVHLLVTPWAAAHQDPLSFTFTQNLLGVLSVGSVTCPTLSSSAAHSPLAFSLSQHQGKSDLRIRWPKYWSFSSSISPSDEYSGLISFRLGYFDLLAVPGLLRVFPSTTVQKHQFFGTQPSFWSNSHICT